MVCIRVIVESDTRMLKKIKIMEGKKTKNKPKRNDVIPIMPEEVQDNLLLNLGNIVGVLEVLID